MEFSLRPLVIAIEKNNNVAAARRDTYIEGGGLPAVFLANKPDARCELTDDVGGPVGRAIVHNDDFELLVREVLTQDATQRLFNEAFVVVGVDENAEKHV